MNTLPERLIVSEAGEWEQASIYSAVNIHRVDHDRDEWISHGWEARTYDGAVTYGCSEKAVLLEWLATNGYKPVGDGLHYQLIKSNVVQLQDCSILPASDEENVWLVKSDYDQESVRMTSLGLVALFDWIGLNKSELIQGALTRRVELQKERGQQ